MDAAPLPEDLNAWPLDPFRLLGVARRTDAKSARRAYVRLIRRFKPEHHPEHFKRIREAYETVEQQLRWQTYEPAPDFDAPPEPPLESPPDAGDSHPAEDSTAAPPDTSPQEMEPPEPFDVEEKRAEDAGAYDDGEEADWEDDDFDFFHETTPTTEPQSQEPETQEAPG